jgi:hypothetical protein
LYSWEVYPAMLIDTLQSAGPNTHNAVLPPLDHVSILNSNTFYYARHCFFLLYVHTSTTIPMSAVRLIVHFSNVLASCRYNPAIIKHHACDWIIVGVCVEYIARPEIPYLGGNHVSVVKRNDFGPNGTHPDTPV